MFQKLFVLSILTLVACCVPKATFCQESNYTNFNSSSGLPSSQVYDIIQDDWGYMWFATDRGLCRYDGANFDHYSTADGILSNTIFKFYKDPDGSGIWCTGLENGVFKISGENPVFKPYQFNHVLTEGAFHDTLLLAMNNMLIDSNRTFYFQYMSCREYLCIDKDGKSNEFDGSYMYSGQPGPVSVGCIIAPDNCFPFYKQKNRLLQSELENHFTVPLFERDRVYRKRPEAVHFPQAQLTIMIIGKSMYFLRQDAVLKILDQKNSSVHIGRFDDKHFWKTSKLGGLQIFDLEGRQQQTYLPNLFTTRCYVDHENNLWIGTLYNGVFKIRNTNVHTVSYNNRSKYVSSLDHDHLNQLWIGYQNGDVIKAKKDTFRLVKKGVEELPAFVSIDRETETILYSSDAKVYDDMGAEIIGSTQYSGFYNYSSDSIHIVCNSIKGAFVWKKDATQFRYQYHKGPRSYQALFFNDTLHYATISGFYKGIGDKMVAVEPDIPVLNARLSDVKRFNNAFALSSMGEGIVLYNGKKTIQITRQNGLSSNYINRLFVENDSVLWASTNHGISKISFHNGSYKIYSLTYDDGLPSNEVTDLTIVNDTVWAGTQNGLCYFPKNLINETATVYSRYLKIDGTYVNDNMTDAESLLSLGHADNRIEFKFSAISFDDIKPLRYRYKLQGLDEQWTYTENRTTTYSSLPPGDYRFILQVEGSDGRWGKEQIVLPINIAPPYWKTLWFRISIILVVILFIYAFFRFRILTYDKDIVREILRQLLKRIRSKSLYIVVKESGEDVRIITKDILFAKSEGNYLAIHTEKGKHLIRERTRNFIDMVPDQLEFVQVHRSYVIRIDKVTKKSKKHVYIGDEKIPVGETYQKEVEKITFE